MKTLWKNWITMLRPISGWPEIRVVSEESVNSPSYHWDGRDRGGGSLMCFQYTLKGLGRCRWRGEELEIPEGHGFLVDIIDREFCYFYPENGKQPWNFIYINFHMENQNMIQSLTETYGPVHALSIEHPFIQNLLNLSDGTSVMSSAKALEWVSLLLQGVASAHQGQNYAMHPIIANAQKFLEQKSHLGWNASQLADALEISREHMTRIFQHELGQTPYRYILNLRVERAKYLLKSSRASCKNIATQCGFDTAPLFGKVFKQINGLSPAKYRRFSGVD